jgi:heme-degrading monooxygenase HmoA
MGDVRWSYLEGYLKKGAGMHIQIVNFQLKDLTEEDYVKSCEQEAPAFAELPGLISKVWLADRETNTYGGVYTWRDRQAMENYMKSELFNAVATDPNLVSVTSKDFAVLERPTLVTRGLAGATV